LFGVIQIAQAGPSEIYTGCLSKGDLTNVRRGSDPLLPCDHPTQEVSWPSTPRVDMALAALQADVAELQTLLADVTRDTDAQGNDRLLLTGMNLQVVNGTGTTVGVPNGEGNVIVGYNTDDGGDTKTGSHSFIAGDAHTYTNNSTVVAGFDHTVEDDNSAAVGGTANTVTGRQAFIGGGLGNEATGDRSFIGAGMNNDASASDSFIGSGTFNSADGGEGFVAGGSMNSASGPRSFATGHGTTASGEASFVSGIDNTASGLTSFVGGGDDGNDAGVGPCAWIADVNVVPC
jgi:hypothetical protein